MLKNKNKMYLIRRMFFINKKKIKFLHSKKSVRFSAIKFTINTRLKVLTIGIVLR